jgi:molecular chaperone DnaK
MKLGIDFGTCFSSAAFMSGGRPAPVRIDYNVTSLASSVYVTEAEEVLVGQDAEDHALENPSRLRREFKRDLGSDVPYLLGNRRFLPEELVALVLAKLKEKAEAQVPSGEPVDEAVLTVPASYEKARRGLMEKAVRQAGFGKVTLLHEPVAAGIYFGSLESGKKVLADDGVLLVYDLGGGTFDAALIRRRDETFETVSPPVGSDQLGGGCFDDLILEDLRRRSSPALSQRLDPCGYERSAAGRLSLQRIFLRARDECRQLKHKLTSAQQGKIFFDEAPLESYVLTRVELERLISPVVTETLDLCRRLLEVSGMDGKSLAGALLVGGTCRIPYIRSEVERVLGCPAFLADDPALAVCLGAALHGAEADEDPSGKPWTGWSETFADPFDAFAERKEVS